MRAVFGLVALFWLCAGGLSCTISPDLSMSGQPCGSLPCEASGASLTAAIPVSRADVPMLSIEVCRNEVCVRTPAMAIPDGSGYSCDVFGPVSASCRVTPIASGTTAQLELTFNGPGSDFVNGDHYVITVATAAAVTIYSLDERVNYRESRPNGPACDPLCRAATL